MQQSVNIYFASCADINSNSGFMKEMERDWTGWVAGRKPLDQAQASDEPPRRALPLNDYVRGIRFVTLVAHGFQHGRAECLLVGAFRNLALAPDYFFTTYNAD
jgi:hypothetical protein